MMDLLLGPRLDAGSVFRVVARGGLAVPEELDRVACRWTEASADLLTKVPFFPEASPALLASLAVRCDTH